MHCANFPRHLGRLMTRCLIAHPRCGYDVAGGRSVNHLAAGGEAGGERGSGGVNGRGIAGALKYRAPATQESTAR